jgi:BirA family biotin operon repressor/biotin-[acetyl-CoA-carboxylase] ligase
VSLPIKIKKFLLEQNSNLIHLESVGSTMKEIKKHIGDKNICLIADEQTEGIGRRGSQWVSPKGNIYLSFLLEYNLLIEDHFLFTAVAANSIMLCLNNYINENIYIKWPNDIIVNGSKIAGIMTEIVEHNDIKYVIIGIGINIETSPKLSDYKTCCVNNFNSKLIYEEFLLNFFQNFFSEYAMIINNEHNNIINKFRNNMKDLEKKITILLPNGKKEKVFLKNLNSDGSLLIEKEGKQESVFSARIIDDFN